MKKALYFIMGFCLIALVAKADVFDEIATAIKSGNAREVAKYFDNNVELKIVDKSSVYSRNQAEMVLNDFFSKNQPTSFSVIHRGSSSKGARYAIGTLTTGQGSYRTYIYIKEVSGRLYIQELSIDKE